MSKTIEFILHCTPAPQARARHMSRQLKSGKHMSMAYKSSKQKENEKELDALLREHAPDKPIEGAVQVICDVWLPMARSTHKSQREKRWHTNKPDVDNFAKNLLDAMTRCGFWNDDNQVSVLCVSKKYADYGTIVGRWHVGVTRLEGRK